MYHLPEFLTVMNIREGDHLLCWVLGNNTLQSNKLIAIFCINLHRADGSIRRQAMSSLRKGKLEDENSVCLHFLNYCQQVEEHSQDL